ncbi:MAG: hypothetical protein J5I62_03460 [Flavobacteriales bacterium]|nr:hypothetical protein [Flavobacteriales bacterium]MEB2341160.1 hypothetical protein [Flavobacteriia bacterium]
MANHRAHSTWALIAAVVALAFGMVTIMRGGSVLFDIGGARGPAGHIVPIVLPLVFLTGFLYVGGGIGLLTQAKWSQGVFLAALALLIVAGVGMVLHMREGLPYEVRTTRALPVRTLVTVLLYVAARRARHTRKDQTHPS